MHWHGERRGNTTARNALVPMLSICALTLLVLLAMLWIDTTWSGPVIVVSLVVCLGVMLVIGAVSHRSPR
jgi:hypothetical protein